MRPHLGAFEGVVVDKHDRIGGEIQFTAGVCQIARLGAPIHRADGEIGRFEGHVGAKLERIVLGKQDEHNAAGAQIQKSALECRVGREVLFAVFGQDALPQRIVGVDRENLLGGGQAREGELVHNRLYAGEGIGAGGQRLETRVVEAGHFLLQHLVVGGHVHERVRLEPVQG